MCSGNRTEPTILGVFHAVSSDFPNGTSVAGCERVVVFRNPILACPGPGIAPKERM